MNYGGNISDWHQYNPPQTNVNEVSTVDHNVDSNRLTFVPSISPPPLNSLNFSAEGFKKYQNNVNYGTRYFAVGNNIPNGRSNNDNFALPSIVQMQECAGQHPTFPSNRNSTINNVKAPTNVRNVTQNPSNKDFRYGNNHINTTGPNANLNVSDLNINAPVASMGSRNTNVCPISSGRNGPPPFIPCKSLCCNPNPKIPYQQWEKYGSYQTNVPSRENIRLPEYEMENRQFSEHNFRKENFDNKEAFKSSIPNADYRRNFPEYKYSKDPLMYKGCPPASRMQPNYPVQNYNYVGECQKYSYPMKDYSRADQQDSSKHQEQNLIAQPKYTVKQQSQYTVEEMYPNKGVSTSNANANAVPSTQSSYYNPQFFRNVSTEFSRTCQKTIDNAPLVNGAQSTAAYNTYPRYHLYEQKLAMQRFSMENYLRELVRIPGYQSHPKYKESMHKYREILKLQQSFVCQSHVQSASRTATASINAIEPTNLQYDQNGILINPYGLPNALPKMQHTFNSNPENGEEKRVKEQILNTPESQGHTTSAHSKQSLNHAHKEYLAASYAEGIQLQGEFLTDKCRKESEFEAGESKSDDLNPLTANTANAEEAQRKISKDFADKPTLDVRQFLANWDESIDEDDSNSNLPDVVLSNTVPLVLVDYQNVEQLEKSPQTMTVAKEVTSDSNELILRSNDNDNASNRSMEECSTVSYIPVGETSALKITSECKTKDTDGGAAAMEIPTIHIVDNLEINNVLEVSADPVITTLTDQECTAFYEEERSDETKTASYADQEDGSPKKDNTNELSDDRYDANGQNISGETYHDDASTLEKMGDSIIPENNEDVLRSSSKANLNAARYSNLKKQNSFTSEESHNPDDISLPDLPTSECTPISTTLNTPIHSDSEEPSTRVASLSTNPPIEIIESSPMISFSHSAMKMESYEEDNIISKNHQNALQLNFQEKNQSNANGGKEHAKIPDNCDNFNNVSKSELSGPVKSGKSQNRSKILTSVNGKIGETGSLPPGEYEAASSSINARKDLVEVTNDAIVEKIDGSRVSTRTSKYANDKKQIASADLRKFSFDNHDANVKQVDDKIQFTVNIKSFRNTSKHYEIVSENEDFVKCSPTVKTHIVQTQKTDRKVVGLPTEDEKARISESTNRQDNFEHNPTATLMLEQDTELYLQKQVAEKDASFDKKFDSIVKNPPNADNDEGKKLVQVYKKRFKYVKDPKVDDVDASNTEVCEASDLRTPRTSSTPVAKDDVESKNEAANPKENICRSSSEETLYKMVANADTATFSRDKNNSERCLAKTPRGDVRVDKIQSIRVTSQRVEDVDRKKPETLTHLMENQTSESRLVKNNSKNSNNAAAFEHQSPPLTATYSVTSEKSKSDQSYVVSDGSSLGSSDTDVKVQQIQITNVNLTFKDNDARKETLSLKDTARNSLHDCTDGIKIEINVLCADRNAQKRASKRSEENLGSEVSAQGNTSSLPRSKEQHAALVKGTDDVAELESARVDRRATNKFISKYKELDIMDFAKRPANEVPYAQESKNYDTVENASSSSQMEEQSSRKCSKKKPPDASNDSNSATKRFSACMEVDPRIGDSALESLDERTKSESDAMDKNVVFMKTEDGDGRRHVDEFNVEYNHSIETYLGKDRDNSVLALPYSQATRFLNAQKNQAHTAKSIRFSEKEAIAEVRVKSESEDHPAKRIFTEVYLTSDKSNAMPDSQMQKWKHPGTMSESKLCDLYETSDVYVNPIFASADESDNGKKITVYTTKDGKITYSPNPRFMRRALIMEGRGSDPCKFHYSNDHSYEYDDYSKLHCPFKAKRESFHSDSRKRMESSDREDAVGTFCESNDDVYKSGSSYQGRSRAVSRCSKDPGSSEIKKRFYIASNDQLSINNNKHFRYCETRHREDKSKKKEETMESLAYSSFFHRNNSKYVEERSDNEAFVPQLQALVEPASKYVDSTRSCDIKLKSIYTMREPAAVPCPERALSLEKSRSSTNDGKPNKDLANSATRLDKSEVVEVDEDESIYKSSVAEKEKDPTESLASHLKKSSRDSGLNAPEFLRLSSTKEVAATAVSETPQCDGRLGKDSAESLASYLRKSSRDSGLSAAEFLRLSSTKEIAAAAVSETPQCGGRLGKDEMENISSEYDSSCYPDRKAECSDSDFIAIKKRVRYTDARDVYSVKDDTSLAMSNVDTLSSSRNINRSLQERPIGSQGDKDAMSSGRNYILQEDILDINSPAVAEDKSSIRRMEQKEGNAVEIKDDRPEGKAEVSATSRDNDSYVAKDKRFSLRAENVSDVSLEKLNYRQEIRKQNDSIVLDNNVTYLSTDIVANVDSNNHAYATNIDKYEDLFEEVQRNVETLDTDKTSVETSSRVFVISNSDFNDVDKLNKAQRSEIGSYLKEETDSRYYYSVNNVELNNKNISVNDVKKSDSARLSEEDKIQEKKYKDTSNIDDTMSTETYKIFELEKRNVVQSDQDIPKCESDKDRTRSFIEQKIVDDTKILEKMPKISEHTCKYKNTDAVANEICTSVVSSRSTNGETNSHRRSHHENLMSEGNETNFGVSCRDTNVNDAADEPVERLQIFHHPKIPKIIIRNTKSVRSCPSTPVAEETATAMSEFSCSANPRAERSAFIVENRTNDQVNETNSEFSWHRYSADGNKIPKVRIKLKDTSFIKSESAESACRCANTKRSCPKVKTKKARIEMSSSNDYEKSSVESSDEGTHESANNDLTRVFDAKEEKKRIPKLRLKRHGANKSSSSEAMKKRSTFSDADIIFKRYRTSSENETKPSTKEQQKFLKDTASTSQCDIKSKSRYYRHEKIPKVIIKRSSADAEFKCEFSENGESAILNSTRWQPEVKLERCQTLDNMARNVKCSKRSKVHAIQECLDVFSARKRHGPFGRSSDLRRKEFTKSNKLFKSNSLSDIFSAKFRTKDASVCFDSGNKSTTNAKSSDERKLLPMEKYSDCLCDSESRDNAYSEFNYLRSSNDRIYESPFSDEATNPLEKCIQRSEARKDERIGNADKKHVANEEETSKRKTYSDSPLSVLEATRTCDFPSECVDSSELKCIVQSMSEEYLLESSIRDGFLCQTDKPLEIIKTDYYYHCDGKIEASLELEGKTSNPFLFVNSSEDNDCSVIKLDSSDESQTTIEILAASPDVSQAEVSLEDIRMSNFVNDGQRLYSEDAIPTQFELELEVTDNNDVNYVVVPSSSFNEPKFSNLPCRNNEAQDVSELSLSSSEANNDFHRSHSKSESDLTNNNHRTSDCKTDSCISFVAENEKSSECVDAVHALVIEDDPSHPTKKVEATALANDNVCCDNSLVKEVLAAKETLKRCFARSRSESKIKFKTKLKSAMQRKLNSCFELNNFARKLGGSPDSRRRDEEIYESKTNRIKQWKTDYKLYSEEFEKNGYRPDANEKITAELVRETEKEVCSMHGFATVPINTLPRNFTTISLKSLKRFEQSLASKGADKSKNTACGGGKNVVDPSEQENSFYHSQEYNEDVKVEHEKDSFDIKKREDNMPILVPEVAFDRNTNSDRDSSRSPPLITSQEGGTNDDVTDSKGSCDHATTEKKKKQESKKDTHKEHEMTVADIVTQLAYHKKATIKHRRYCTLCEKWFPTTSRHRRHLAGYQHRHLELVQRRSIHALFILFTGKPCPKLLRATTMRTDCSIGELTPLQIAVQDLAKFLEHT